MAQPSRFRDPGEYVGDFADDALVVCPNCAACAQSARIDRENQDHFAPRRLTCGECGCVRDWTGKATSSSGNGEPRDDHFGLPLWLQTSSCGETLWAYNRRHLEFLEGIVGAKHRERTRDAEFGWRNASLASRLPKWILAAKNRDAVLVTIKKLRQRLPGDPS